MGNPFRYGVVVTGKDFVDREKELGELTRELRGGKSVVLYSNRRMGKSSLLAELSRRNGKEFAFATVDLYGVTEKSRFLELFSNAVVHATYGRVGRFASDFADLVKNTGLRMVVTEKGSLGVELIEREPGLSSLEEILDLAEKGARRKRKRVVVIFDEFQEVAAFDGIALLKRMRSRFQTHRNAVYVFSGSKRHLLHSIFEEREGAFFKFARPMELGPIPKKEFADFLVKRFRTTGGAIDIKIAKRLVDVSSGYPYYAQQLAYELYVIKRSNPSDEDVAAAVKATLDHQSPAYSYVWDSIRSPLQRKYLRAIAEEPKAVAGTVFIERHGLQSRSHVQRIQKQLEMRGLVEAGEIVDPLFALWLRRLSNTDL